VFLCGGGGGGGGGDLSAVSIFSVVKCGGRKEPCVHDVTPLNTAVLLQSLD